MDGTHCKHSLTTQTADYTKAEWDDMSIGWICTDSAGFTDDQTALETFCRQYTCNYQTTQLLQGMVTKMHDMKKRIKAAKLRQHMEEEHESN